jgi:F-type H+-transporting ATPase subunit epsilon
VISVDIVTPHKKLVDGAQVSSLKLPSARGQLTILPGHAELLTLLGTGELSFAADGQERKFAVSYGFANVSHDKVTVLAETCEEASEIDRSRAQKAQQKSQERLGGTLTQEDFKKYQLKLQRALVRQSISSTT